MGFQLSSLAFSEPKLKAKVITVTSGGTWRSSNKRINLDWVTHLKYTSVKIIRSKAKYHVGDTLVLEVIARDGNKRRKMYGGDYFTAVLRDKVKKASTTGRVQDHGNGLYTVSFLLSFPGKVTLEVQLVHPSEAVQLLRELREVPNKRTWSCVFKSKPEDVRANCTLLANRSLDLSSQCDFSVKNTSRNWFCAKPKGTSCDSITKCTSLKDTVDKLLNSAERRLFERPFFRMNLTADTKGPIIVSDVNENTTVKRPLPFCHPRLQHSEYQGFWLRGTWHSLSCKVRQFSSREITKCLTNRTVHFRGDSTLRQWIQRLGELKIMHPGPGDPYFRPYTNNRRQIQVTFKFHTVPIQVSAWFKFKNLTDSGVSNDIMKMIGGENVVLVLSLCSHFTAEPTHVYTFRMYELRSAIEQLHKKYPKTTVIVKTCNTRNHRHYREVVQMSDWLADQLNQEMRNILGSLNVAILDVWDMTVSQWYPYNIHPHEHVVDNELNMLMSYICPMMVKNV
ncbi:NXPE family member 3-like isoform X1 [Branchiostoma floridae]|uniref:NXPE family member 3-like isoform X1 n=1 Tax=Branchiostoma floridae TaxID=7739 RepID=A0A9J7MX22_BRAFL|nr:NXPE family member 3-like isoform X1 [Branchiostoma floridae]